MDITKVVTIKTVIDLRLTREDVEYAIRRKYDLPETARFDWDAYGDTTLENSYHVLQGMLDEARDQRALLEAALLVVVDRAFADELLAMNRSNMIDAIKFVRNRTGLGLKQSKEFVEGLWAANPL